jgi:hypothetical protein
MFACCSYLGPPLTSSSQMHPLLLELLNSRTAPHPDTELFDRTTASSHWIRESALSRLLLQKNAPLRDEDDSESEEESDGEYDVGSFVSLVLRRIPLTLLFHTTIARKGRLHC